MAKKFTMGAKVTVDGEKEYKQAISGISQAQRLLKSEMERTKAEYAGNEKSIESLTSKSDIYKKQIDEQKKKIEEMQKALKHASETYGETDSKTVGWQVTLNKAEAELFKLNRELKQNDEELEKAKTETVEATEAMDDYGDEVEDVDKASKGFGDTLKNAGIAVGIAVIAKAAKEGAEKVKELATNAASYADDVLTMAAQTGIATESIQEFMYMQELTDVSVETLTSSMARQIRSMGNAQKGTKEIVEAYDKLGISVMDSNGALRDSETIYWEVIDALGRMENDTERDAIAMQLMGRSAQELNPIIQIGSKGISEFASEARKMGAVLDNETLDSLGAADDAMQRTNLTIDIAKRKIGAELAPEVAKASERIVSKVLSMDDEFAHMAGNGIELVATGLEFLIDNSKLVISGLSGIVAGLITFKTTSIVVHTVTSIMDGYKKATVGATGAQAALNAVQAASPAGLIAVGVGALAGALTYVALTSESAKTETDLYIESLEKMNAEVEQSINSIDNSMKAIDDNKESIEAEHAAIQMLTDELFNLSDKTRLTNGEKERMKALVDELNKALPELNLTLDEETGLLNKQKGEVDGLIQTNLQLYKVKAARESLVNIAKSQYEAESNLKELEEKRLELQEKYNSAYSAAQNARNTSSYRQYGYSSSYNESKKEYKEMEKQLKENEKNIQKYKNQIVELGDKWQDANDYIAEKGAIVDATQKVKELGEASEETAEKIVYTSEEATKAIEDLNKTYSEALDKRTGEIKNAMGLFDKFTLDPEISGNTLLENLESQIDGMDQWGKNIESLSKRGLAQGLVDELKNMGTKSASEVNALNQLTDKELSKYSKLWEDKNKLARKLAEAQLKELKAETDTQIEEINKSLFDKGAEAAENFAKGFASKRSLWPLELEKLMDDDRLAGSYDNNIAKAPPSLNAVAPQTSLMGASILTSNLDYTKLKAIIREAVEGIQRDVVLEGEKVGKYATNYMTKEMYAR